MRHCVRHHVHKLVLDLELLVLDQSGYGADHDHLVWPIIIEDVLLLEGDDLALALIATQSPAAVLVVFA
jgi:hypothetical protein